MSINHLYEKIFPIKKPIYAKDIPPPYVKSKYITHLFLCLLCIILTISKDSVEKVVNAPKKPVPIKRAILD